MKLSNLRGLEQDLNQGINYNRKHGGVSRALREIKKRPGGSNWRLSAMLNYSEKYTEGWERIFSKK